MSRIKQMDEILANKIAAGEVVERCSSVVKELVENSIDAKSSEIRIDLLEAGTKEIKVTDNGIGMDKDDAILAFSRHATSKIKTEDDLFHINTLGFRGEALASIAAVSHVHMETCDGDIGTVVDINGGKLDSVKPGISRVGTQIIIRDLFYNVPARLKHLKSLYTELASITDYVNKIALSHPDIKFVLTNNNSVLLNTDGSGNLLKVIKAIYGIETVKKMVDVCASDNDYEISGFISLPEVHRSSRNTMITLVNGRVVRNQELNRVINDSYHSYKPDNRYPIVVLNIILDPSQVDVNIHPTKMDIKFSKLEELKELISNMIKKVLSEGIFIPDALENNESVIEKPKYVEQIIDFEKVKEDSEEYVIIDNGYNTNLFDLNDLKKENVVEKKEIIEKEEIVRYPSLEVVGIIHKTYIVCQNETGAFLVDQHAAKERCNYELFLSEMGKPIQHKISLLFPYTLEYSAEEFIILKNHFDVLNNIGFEIEEFGINSVIVKAHPNWLSAEAIEDDIRKILDLILEVGKNFSIEKFNEKFATMMACRHAIKAGDYISLEEASKLLEDLKKCKNPFNCPHGRPTTISFTNYEIEKMFKRTGFDNYK